MRKSISPSSCSERYGKTAGKNASDFSGSRVKTSAQAYAPGVSVAWKPSWVPACHTPKTAPPGSRARHIVPKSATCIGSMSSSPPFSRMRAAVAEASWAAR